MKGILIDKKCLMLFLIIISLTFLSACGGVTPTNYTIISTTGIGGTILPGGNIAVSEGGSQTFTITPDDGYLIEDVLVDGASVGLLSTYSFTNVIQNHTIQASFVFGLE